MIRFYKNANKVILASIAALMLGACASTSATLDGEDRKDTAYLLTAGDDLAITIFDEPDLSGTYRIDESGHVDLPLIGLTNTTNISTTQFQALLTEAYQGRYLQNPLIRVELANPRPVYILGEVRNPGEYEYTGAMTMLQGVAKAGGFSYRANRSVVYVLHHRGTEEKKYKLTPTTIVQPGDTIRIVQRFF